MTEIETKRKVALHSLRKPVLSKGVHYKLEINKDRCKGCQLCIFYCPAKHLELSEQLNKRGVNFVKIKKNSKCLGCGFCFFICPESCIEIYESKVK